MLKQVGWIQFQLTMKVEMAGSEGKTKKMKQMKQRNDIPNGKWILRAVDVDIAGHSELIYMMMLNKMQERDENIGQSKIKYQLRVDWSMDGWEYGECGGYSTDTQKWRIKERVWGLDKYLHGRQWPLVQIKRFDSAVVDQGRWSQTTEELAKCLICCLLVKSDWVGGTKTKSCRRWWLLRSHATRVACTPLSPHS